MVCVPPPKLLVAEDRFCKGWKLINLYSNVSSNVAKFHVLTYEEEREEELFCYCFLTLKLISVDYVNDIKLCNNLFIKSEFGCEWQSPCGA
jgi:hypothetical protein